MPLVLNNANVASIKGLVFRESKGDGTGGSFYYVTDTSSQSLKFYARLTESEGGAEGGRLGLAMKGERAALMSAHSKAYRAACKGKGGLKPLVNKDTECAPIGEAFPVVANIKTTAKGAFANLQKAVESAFCKDKDGVLENLEKQKPRKPEYASHIDCKVPATAYHAYLENHEEADIPKLMTSGLEGASVALTCTGVHVRKEYDEETETQVHYYSVKFRIDNIYAIPHIGKGTREQSSPLPEDPVAHEDMDGYIDSLYKSAKKTPKKQKRSKEDEDEDLAKDIEKEIDAEEATPVKPPHPKKQKPRECAIEV